MTIQTLAQGARSALVLDLGTLAAGTYITTAAIDLGAGSSTAIPLDTTLEVVANANGTPVGGKQIKIFAKLSLDNTNWGSGPETGTTYTEEADLHLIDVLPMNDTNDHRKFFSTRGLPVTRYIKFVFINDLGVALTSGSVYRADITGIAT